MRRIRTLTLSVLLATAPAAATAEVQGAAADIAPWLAANTDMRAAQVVIAGPELVYSLEPVGPRTPAGEIIALVRAEALSTSWNSEHGFQSWDGHVLFDCSNGRFQQIRSATYAKLNRQGAPRAETPREGWISPAPGQPSMQLLAAACDVNFAWPLRARPARVAQIAARKIEEPPPKPMAPLPVAVPPMAAPLAAAEPGFAVQVARGPREDGASLALRRARRALGTDAESLVSLTDESKVGNKRRYTAILAGFPTAAAAADACDRLIKAAQECLLRAVSPGPDARTLPTVAKTEPSLPASAAPAAAPDSGSAADHRWIQLARGPSEEGALLAIKRTRKLLDAEFAGLRAVTEKSMAGDRPRYTAALGEFPTEEAAAQACELIHKAAQNCFTRAPPKPAPALAEAQPPRP